MYKFLYPVLLFAAIFVAACGDDDDPVTPNNCTSAAFSTALSDAVMALSDAAVAYGNDPTQANCDAWRQEANDYLDAVEGFETCAAVTSTQEYQDALAQARQEVNNFSCN
ncbi:hypothetical protein [Lewinella sp. W8]|uniref:hypothetical protein n=1 Tax=Lewinella sp. W8 TaxID=2528208 RepID=UPI0010687A86|nr:hypothetical protein [Lewinella sp. W8]MTB49766.1 hypothetical protein [Lewinella sp. W8]